MADPEIRPLDRPMPRHLAPITPRSPGEAAAHDPLTTPPVHQRIAPTQTLREGDFARRASTLIWLIEEFSDHDPRFLAERFQADSIRHFQDILGAMYVDYRALMVRAQGTAWFPILANHYQALPGIHRTLGEARQLSRQAERVHADMANTERDPVVQPSNSHIGTHQIPPASQEFIDIVNEQHPNSTSDELRSLAGYTQSAQLMRALHAVAAQRESSRVMTEEEAATGDYLDHGRREEVTDLITGSPRPKTGHEEEMADAQSEHDPSEQLDTHHTSPALSPASIHRMDLIDLTGEPSRSQSEQRSQVDLTHEGSSSSGSSSDSHASVDVPLPDNDEELEHDQGLSSGQADANTTGPSGQRTAILNRYPPGGRSPAAPRAWIVATALASGRQRAFTPAHLIALTWQLGGQPAAIQAARAIRYFHLWSPFADAQAVPGVTRLAPAIDSRVAGQTLVDLIVPIQRTHAPNYLSFVRTTQGSSFNNMRDAIAFMIGLCAPEGRIIYNGNARQFFEDMDRALNYQHFHRDIVPLLRLYWNADLNVARLWASVLAHNVGLRDRGDPGNPRPRVTHWVPGHEGPLSSAPDDTYDGILDRPNDSPDPHQLETDHDQKRSQSPSHAGSTNTDNPEHSQSRSPPPSLGGTANADNPRVERARGLSASIHAPETGYDGGQPISDALEERIVEIYHDSPLAQELLRRLMQPFDLEPGPEVDETVRRTEIEVRGLSTIYMLRTDNQLRDVIMRERILGEIDILLIWRGLQREFRR